MRFVTSVRPPDLRAPQTFESPKAFFSASPSSEVRKENAANDGEGLRPLLLSRERGQKSVGGARVGRGAVGTIHHREAASFVADPGEAVGDSSSSSTAAIRINPLTYSSSFVTCLTSQVRREYANKADGSFPHL